MTGSTTQEVEALKRRVHERVGAFVVEHWTQILSALGGALVGAGGIYLTFTAQIHNAVAASADAKAAALDLKASVAQLQGTVGQLVTERELAEAVTRIQELEDWRDYAKGYKPPHPLSDHLPKPKKGEK